MLFWASYVAFPTFVMLQFICDVGIITSLKNIPSECFQSHPTNLSLLVRVNASDMNTSSSIYTPMIRAERRDTVYTDASVPVAGASVPLTDAAVPFTDASSTPTSASTTAFLFPATTIAATAPSPSVLPSSADYQARGNLSNITSDPVATNSSNATSYLLVNAELEMNDSLFALYLLLLIVQVSIFAYKVVEAHDILILVQSFGRWGTDCSAVSNSRLFLEIIANADDKLHDHPEILIHRRLYQNNVMAWYWERRMPILQWYDWVRFRSIFAVLDVTKGEDLAGWIFILLHSKYILYSRTLMPPSDFPTILIQSLMFLMSCYALAAFNACENLASFDAFESSSAESFQLFSLVVSVLFIHGPAFLSLISLIFLFLAVKFSIVRKAWTVDEHVRDSNLFAVHISPSFIFLQNVPHTVRQWCEDQVVQKYVLFPSN